MSLLSELRVVEFVSGEAIGGSVSQEKKMCSLKLADTMKENNINRLKVFGLYTKHYVIHLVYNKILRPIRVYQGVQHAHAKENKENITTKLMYCT